MAAVATSSRDKLLTDGLLELVLKEKNNRLNPIVQILNSQSITPLKIQVHLSDGKSCISNCYFSSEKLDKYFCSGKLQQYTVVSLNRFEFAETLEDGTTMIVKEVSILKPGQLIGHKIDVGERFQVAPLVPSAPKRQNAVAYPRQVRPRLNYYDDWLFHVLVFEPVVPRINLITINSISRYSSSWKIRGRVIGKTPIRLFNKNGSGKIFSFDLKDETGQVNVVAFNSECDRFFNSIENNKLYFLKYGYVMQADKRYSTSKYQIKLTMNSVIEPCNEILDIPNVPSFNFVPLAQIKSLATGVRLDAIGAIRSVSDVQQITSRKSKKRTSLKRVNIVDKSMIEVTITLWDESANDFKATPGQVIALKSAIVTEYFGKQLKLSNSTLLEVEPNLPEVTELKEWYRTQGIRESYEPIYVGPESFTNTSFINLITSLNPHQVGNSNLYYNVSAKVMKIFSNEELFYQGCETVGCNKKVDEDKVCSSCNKVSPVPLVRMKIPILLLDATGSVRTTVFGGQAFKVFGMYEEELVQLSNDDQSGFMKTINSILLRQFHFRLKAHKETYNNVERIKVSIVNASLIANDNRKRSKDLLKMINSISHQL